MLPAIAPAASFVWWVPRGPFAATDYATLSVRPRSAAVSLPASAEAEGSAARDGATGPAHTWARCADRLLTLPALPALSALPGLPENPRRTQTVPGPVPHSL